MTRLRPLYRLRLLRDPAGLLRLSYLVHHRREARVGGQLVERWAFVGAFESWREAMEELTGQPPYPIGGGG